MAKKKKKHQRNIPAPVAAPPAPLFAKRAMRILFIGAVLVIAGFILLSQTDPAGQNWQSIASPLLLILGYALIGVGLLVKRPAETTATF